jgi:branched-chain amino acid transport system substrate-binding protein
MKALATILVFLGLFTASSPLKAEDNTIRIGVLTDMTGGMAALSGKGSVEAAEMAIEDFSARTKEARAVSLISADYQNRGDLAQHISEDWINKQGVDVVVDVPNASITSRLQDLFKEKNRLMLTSCPSTAPGNMCSSSGISWLYGLDVLTANLVQALLLEKKTRWFIIGQDDPYSQDMAAQVIKLLRKAGAKIVGEAQLARRMAGLDIVLQQIDPNNTDVIFLAFDHPDLLHLLRRWPTRKIGVPLALSALHTTDIMTVRPDIFPIYIITPFYWEQDAVAMKWSASFAARNEGLPPSAIQASVYSSVLHYLKAAHETPNAEPATLMAYMKKTPLDSVPFGPSQVRGDGIVAHRLHLLLSKAPSERTAAWDYFKAVRTLQPNELLLPPEMKCDLP